MHVVPVLIAGGGPVGTTLAIDLASRGTPCLVVEQRRDQPPNPRCNTTNARSMEFFRRLGIADEIRQAGLPQNHPTDVVYLTQWMGDELTRYQLPSSSMAKSSTGSVDDGWPTPEPQHRICQLFLEPILRDHARSMEGLEFREGWRFESYRTTADGVVSTVRNLESGRSEEVQSRFLVGAEGARSVVRSTMGASFSGRSQVARSVSTFLRCDRLAELNQRWQGWMFRVVGRDRYHRFVAIDGGSQWIYHLTIGFDDDVESIDIASELADAIGESVSFEILGQVDWVGRAMVADRFRDGNVFLAGDAAHIWIPMGGFGMNAGIADATNLSWKLTAALDGWGGERLLDSYERERKPVGELVAEAAVGINRDLMTAIAGADGAALSGPAGAAARQELGSVIAGANTTEFNSVGMQLGYHYAASEIVAGDGTPAPDFSLGHYQETSRPGVRAPHRWLEEGVSVHDRLGPGFTLLLLGEAPPSPINLVAAAERRGLPLTLVEVASSEVFEAYERYPLVLIRPDQHIAWRGMSEPDRPEDVIDHVRGG